MGARSSELGLAVFHRDTVVTDRSAPASAKRQDRLTAAATTAGSLTGPILLASYFTNRRDRPFVAGSLAANFTGVCTSVASSDARKKRSSPGRGHAVVMNCLLPTMPIEPQAHVEQGKRFREDRCGLGARTGADGRTAATNAYDKELSNTPKFENATAPFNTPPERGSTRSETSCCDDWPFFDCPGGVLFGPLSAGGVPLDGGELGAGSGDGAGSTGAGSTGAGSTGTGSTGIGSTAAYGTNRGITAKLG